ncbi:MAG: hypothetical protein IJD64_02815 [Clostridia bacterium]|nr:hypothetical protein [Clostridia bacterium]
MKNLWKKSLLVILALLLAISLIACEGKKQPADSDDDDGEDKKVNAEETITFSVTCNGTTVELGKPMASVLDALGEANSIQDAPSCGDGTTRKVYHYSSLMIYTLTANGAETIDEIVIRDDTVETAAKISIGSSESDVRKAYGTPSTEKEGTLTYVSGQNELTIDLADGKVSAIDLLRKTN